MEPPHDASKPQRRTKAGRLVSSITREELESCFHMPSEHACRHLGVGLTILKRICRRFGIPRWPYNRQARLEDGSGDSSLGGAGNNLVPSQGPLQVQPYLHAIGQQPAWAQQQQQQQHAGYTQVLPLPQQQPQPQGYAPLLAQQPPGYVHAPQAQQQGYMQPGPQHQRHAYGRPAPGHPQSQPPQRQQQQQHSGYDHPPAPHHVPAHAQQPPPPQQRGYLPAPPPPAQPPGFAAPALSDQQASQQLQSLVANLLPPLQQQQQQMGAQPLDQGQPLFETGLQALLGSIRSEGGSLERLHQQLSQMNAAAQAGPPQQVVLNAVQQLMQLLQQQQGEQQQSQLQGQPGDAIVAAAAVAGPLFVSQQPTMQPPWRRIPTTPQGTQSPLDVLAAAVGCSTQQAGGPASGQYPVGVPAPAAAAAAAAEEGVPTARLAASNGMGLTVSEGQQGEGDEEDEEEGLEDFLGPGAPVLAQAARQQKLDEFLGALQVVGIQQQPQHARTQPAPALTAADQQTAVIAASPAAQPARIGTLPEQEQVVAWALGDQPPAAPQPPPTQQEARVPQGVGAVAAVDASLVGVPHASPQQVHQQQAHQQEQLEQQLVAALPDLSETMQLLRRAAEQLQVHLAAQRLLRGQAASLAVSLPARCQLLGINAELAELCTTTLLNLLDGPGSGTSAAQPP